MTQHPGVPTGALLERLAHQCEECSTDVYKTDNNIYLDREPLVDGGDAFAMYLLPLGPMLTAAGGAGPPGVARFDLHDHQPAGS